MNPLVFVRLALKLLGAFIFIVTAAFFVEAWPGWRSLFTGGATNNLVGGAVALSITAVFCNACGCALFWLGSKDRFNFSSKPTAFWTWPMVGFVVSLGIVVCSIVLVLTVSLF